MPKTAVGRFREDSSLKQAAAEIEGLGFPRSRVRVLGEPLDFAVTGVMSIPHIEFEVDLARELIRIGASQQEAEAYVDGVREGGVLMFVTGKDEPSVDASAEVMNQYGAKRVAELGGPVPVFPSRSHANAPAHQEADIQTGRIRQHGGGARVFTW